MMAQYLEIKAGRHPGRAAVLPDGRFLRDVLRRRRRAAEALDIALTKRGKHAGEDIPMCGVPVHAAENYLLTLIRKGSASPSANRWKTRRRPRNAAPRRWSGARSCGWSRPAR
jgi:DNA mismatch repair ATPase MutS